MVSQEFWDKLLDERIAKWSYDDDEDYEGNYGYGDDYDPDDLDF